MDISKDKLQIINTLNEHIKVESKPGSGKTVLLSNYVKNLIDNGVDPKKILVLMFSQKNQKDFIAKLHKTGVTNDIKVNTLHAYGYYLTRRLINAGIVPQTIIRDDEDPVLINFVRQVMIDISNKKGYTNTQLSNEAVKECLRNYNLLRNVDFEIDNIENPIQSVYINPFYIDVYEALKTQWPTANMMPMCELIATSTEVIRDNQRFHNFLSKEYEYILVDEAQDLSFMDFAMIRNHLNHATNLVTVGDSNQTINQFRGSNQAILKNLKELLPRLKEFKLTSSYRFSIHLDKLSLKVLNQEITTGNVYANKLTQSNIDYETYIDHRHPLFSSKNLKNESILIVREKNALPYYELLFLLNNKTYNLHGKQPIIFNKGVNTLLAYSLAACPELFTKFDHDIQCRFIQNLVYQPFRQMQPEIAKWLTSMLPSEAFQKLLDAKGITSAFGKVPNTLLSIKENADENTKVSNLWNYMSAFDQIKPILSSSVAKLQQSAMSQVRLLSILEKSNLSLKDFVTLMIKSQYLNITNDENEISFLTAHESKGLEAQSIFLGGMYEGTFPLIRNNYELTPFNLKNELSLFYVAMTRAKQHLTILAPMKENCQSYCQESRFLKQLVG